MQDQLIRCQHCGEAHPLVALLDNTGHGPDVLGPNSGWAMTCECGLSYSADNRNDAIDGWIKIQGQLAIASGHEPDSIFVDPADQVLNELHDAIAEL